jgi:hypothetical protein
MNWLLSMGSMAAALLGVLSGNSANATGAHNEPPFSQQTRQGTVVQCATTRAASVAIPFEQVDLGPAGEVQTGDDLLLGPRIQAVVTDSTRWPAIWRAAVDSVPTPRVAFGGGVFVLAATRTHGLGHIRLRVTSIRQCRASGAVIVTTMQTSPRHVGTSTLSRGFDVVRVSGRELATNVVVFEDRFQLEPR